MSSTIITPTSRLDIVDDGGRDEVVALEHARHLFLVLRRLHPVGLGVHDVLDGHWTLRAQQAIEGDGAEQVASRIDDEDLVESVRQIGRLAHEVDGLADGPERRHRDELGLHAPSGAVFRVVERTLERHALDGGQAVENIRLVLVVEAFENRDRVVRFEVAHAFGDGGGFKLLEDFLADRIVDLCQRGEVEIRAEQFDQAWPMIGVEGFEKIAHFRFVKILDERQQTRRVRVVDRVGDGTEEIRIDLAVFVAERRRLAIGRARRRQIVDVLHELFLDGRSDGLLGAHTLQHNAPRSRNRRREAGIG